MHPHFEQLTHRMAKRPLIMGILNVTPDSFSDGGLWMDPRTAADHARDMADAGADIVDIGGESTRPGAPEVPLQVELDRVIPALRTLRAKYPALPVSVDTQKAEVARQALAEGACMINDVSALRADEGMAAVVATGGAGLCMMHRLEAPGSMAWSPQEGSRYGDEGVSAAVSRFLQERLQACASAGIPAHAVWLDPGLGFGKSVVDNLRLLKDLPGLARLGRPVLVGPSRKSFVGASLGGLAIEDRLAGTLAACAVAVWLGAKVLRVHDVREASQAARLVTAIQHA